MIAATTPPAIHGPIKPCADYKPVLLNAGESVTTYSPDCRWAFSVQASEQLPPLKVPGGFGNKNAVLVNMTTGERQSDFLMESSAALHWLRGGRHAVVNYFDGSGAAQPLLFNLGEAKPPTDLAEMVFPDVLKRIHKRRSQVYHYYVYFIADEGKRITISASPEFTLVGDEGQGDSRCYIYSIDKITLKYHFVQRLPYDDTHPCPHNPDEKWDRP